MKFSKKQKYIAAILVLAIIVGYWWYRSAHATTNQVRYVTATAQQGSITSSISASGNVIVDQSSNIDPTITGTVANLAVNVGDKVTKGQFLFNIVNDQLGVSADQAVASVSQAQASLDSANSQKAQAAANYFDSKKPSVGKNKRDMQALSKASDAASANITSTQQNLSAAQANLAYAQSNAAKRKVTSPIDGTVNAINIKNGDDLSKLSSGSSRTVPMIIGDLSTMKAQVQVNEVDIANVQIGQKVMMTFSGIDGLTVSGKVEKIDSLGTLSSGVVTYNVTITFDTIDPRIKPEMSVSANIITDVKQNVLTVPNSAVKTQNGNTYVQVLNSGQAPTQVSVQTGISNDTDTEILSGINVGDNVVTQTINSSNSSAASTSSSSSRGGSSSAIRVPGLGGGGGFGGR